MSDYEIAVVIWWMANRFGVCHSVSVTQPRLGAIAEVIPLFGRDAA
jgi:hypothetical protein